MTEERLTWHLQNWAEFQRDRKSDYGCDYPSQDTSGAVSTVTRLFDDMVYEVDARCAEAVGAVVDELPPLENKAIHHYHLDAVYRFARASMEDAYQRARAAVKEGLRKRRID